MSGIFGSRVIPGNRLTDIAKQTATVGNPITFGYGRFKVDSPNIIWCDEVKEHVTKKRVGKGGTKTTEYTYTRSYAIAFAKGPLKGYWTIWRNGKVVYTQDPNVEIEDLEYAQKWLEKATLYYGTSTQNPDSTIEAVEGTGQVSAFLDLAYIVLENDDVTADGGGVPQYSAVCIATSEALLTTPPYPILVEEGYSAVSEEARIFEVEYPIEGYDTETTIASAELRDILKFYTMEDEAYDTATEVLSGELRDILKFYTMEPEAYDVLPAEIVSGTLEDILLYYTMEPEGYDCSTAIVSGTLT